MLLEFRAEADIRGGRIDLAWDWKAPGSRPALQLIRRPLEYSIQVGDGLAILNLGDPFWGVDQVWARFERDIYLAPVYDLDAQAAIKLRRPETVLERGLRHAMVVHTFADKEAEFPTLIAIKLYDPATDSFMNIRLDEISRLERTPSSAVPWDSIDTIEVFATPGGGPEVSLGQIVISTQHEDGVTPDRFAWIASGDPPIEVPFGRSLHQQTIVILDETFNMDSGEWSRCAFVEDEGLTPGDVYYYTLFAPDPSHPGEFYSERNWRAMTMPTGFFGLDDKLYQLLPAVHKQYDEPSIDMRGNGQLRKFLATLGTGLNQMRGLAEGLRGRHDLLEARADLLPHMARWIGWQPDLTLPEHAQRRDIRFAPEIYETVGTVPNVRALINHVAARECRVKEFVNNVFLTNAVEQTHLWEIWQRIYDGVDWQAPLEVTHTEGFDGRPAVALDGGGIPWLFWHADRSDRREIWLQRLDGVDPSPIRAMDAAPDDATDLSYTDENPAVVWDGSQLRLAWNSNREGAWDIWTREYTGLPGGEPLNLTEHPADDRHPTTVHVGGETWVFWQSNRRGPTDIWARVHDGTDWGLPSRVTTAAFRHESPAAVVDSSDRIWLFWVADLGECRSLFYQIHDGGVWNTPEPVPTAFPAVCPAPQRDEAPTAVFWNGQVWLFWHTNRDDHWQIWSMSHDGVDWGTPFPVTTHAAEDKEPTAYEDAGGQLQVFWRSQRRGERYKSRTIDTDDPEMLAQLRTFEDRAHYSYDTAEEEEDWYARGVVGLYLPADVYVPEVLDRAKAFVEPFRSLPVRYVWLEDESVFEEIIWTDGLIGDEFTDEIL